MKVGGGGEELIKFSGLRPDLPPPHHHTITKPFLHRLTLQAYNFFHRSIIIVDARKNMENTDYIGLPR